MLRKDIDSWLSGEAQRNFAMATGRKKSEPNSSRGLLCFIHVLILCHSSCFESLVRPRRCLVVGCPNAITMYALRDL